MKGVFIFYSSPIYKMNIAIFASGNGSNAQAIIRHFEHSKEVCIKCIITNNFQAGIINSAKPLGVPTFVFGKEDLNNDALLLDFLQQNSIEFIVLAGYLKKISSAIVTAFPNAIVNIHPALLPQFGGKGMHGMHVHEAVLKSGSKKTGITIHYVNEAYDEGQIIFQESCEVLPNDTAENIAKRVLTLEHKNYPTVLEKLFLQKK